MSAFSIQEILSMFLVFLYVLFFSVLGEEIGWRGYALPELQANHSALTASLIIGVIWGLWHVPLWWMRGNLHQDIPLTLFMLQIIALSIIFTWMYNNTRGSLLIVHLFHAAVNTTVGVLLILPMDTNSDLGPLWLAVGLFWAFTIAIVAIFGPARLSLKARKS
ncbi:MAG: CPBP family intramembrane glutamic endopeptidase [Euryarchaeota archaeon]|nr:CPBP family intramembrane glutamic endopeptidase [Euryarchaeota archaeon]